MLNYQEIQDPVSGNYFPLSESDKKRIERENEAKRSDDDIASLLASILK